MITNTLPRHVFSFSGAQVHVFHVDTGEGLLKHEHNFAHATVCHAGSVVIRKEGVEFVMTKETQPVSLRANEWHEIEALEDNTVFVNIFSLETAKG